MTKKPQPEPPQNFEPGEWIWNPSQGKHIPLELETNVNSPDADSRSSLQEAVSADESGDGGGDT